jgi:NAC domain
MKGLEEVNIFTDDGKVIHITNPKSKSKLKCHFLQIVGAVQFHVITFS